jgi:hypothetical protein
MNDDISCLRAVFFSEPAVKKPTRKVESEDEMDKIDRERMEDLEERDAFAKRIIEKDKEKTRNIVTKSEKKVGRITSLTPIIFIPPLMY